MDYSFWGTRELIDELEEVTGKIGHFNDWGDSEMIEELNRLG